MMLNNLSGPAWVSLSGSNVTNKTLKFLLLILLSISFNSTKVVGQISGQLAKPKKIATTSSLKSANVLFLPY